MHAYQENQGPAIRRSGSGRRSVLITLAVAGGLVVVLGPRLPSLLGAVISGASPSFRTPAGISDAARDHLRSLSPLRRWSLETVDTGTFERVRTQRQREAQSIGPEALSHPVVQRHKPSLNRVTIGHVPVLEIMPRRLAEPRKVLVYLHGGGYVFGTAQDSLPLSVPLATHTGLRTVAVDYTTAPFARWRQILDEVSAVVREIVRQGTPMTEVAIAGESAGAGLAVAATLRLRDEGLGLPAALYLMSPWVDLSLSGDSHATLEAADPLLTTAALRRFASLYAEAAELRNPLVSPLYGDFGKGFPPTLIQAGTRELLLSDAVRLSQAIESGGGRARLDLTDGMPHVFQEQWTLPESEAALARGARFLTGVLVPGALVQDATRAMETPK